MSEVSIISAGIADIGALRELWLTLHRHHRAVTSVDLQPDDDLSWEVRSRFYRELLRTGSGSVLIAFDDATPVGYASLVVHPAHNDDTFSFRGSTGEIYSLVVAASHRNSGVGATLLAAARLELARRGIVDVNVHVMTENAESLRFYERHGFRQVETSLWASRPVEKRGDEDLSPLRSHNSIRRATSADRDVVHVLVREFYEVDRHPYDEAHVDGALSSLLADDTNGQVWLVVDERGGAVGYAVITWSFSLESGGRDCILDEIYVRDRGSGIGGTLLERALAEAQAAGARAVFLETERHNRRVAGFYERHGFLEDDSIWMSRSLL
jgi:ribosomal protein S18 acetylase RimI-like enzyme